MTNEELKSALTAAEAEIARLEEALEYKTSHANGLQYSFDQKHAKFTEAEREIAEQKELVKDACAGRDQWRKTQLENTKLTKENAELREWKETAYIEADEVVRLAKENEGLIVKCARWKEIAQSEHGDLTKQNEEQAKEIERLKLNNEMEKLSNTRSIYSGTEVMQKYEASLEIISVLEDGLKKIYPGLPSYRSLEVYCERRHADELLAKLAEH